MPKFINLLCNRHILLQLNQFHEAEMSLSEANRINNRNVDVWGYLCLLNMTLERYDEFAQCYTEMIKVNLYFGIFF